ncbi:MAG: hypothetical protein ACPG77_05650, partial [Nannocystaceae bacterium]
EFNAYGIIVAEQRLRGIADTDNMRQIDFRDPRLRRHAPSLVAFIRRALSVDARERYEDAIEMFEVFTRLKPVALRYASARRAASRR